MNSLHKETRDFIDAVVAPLESHKACQVPDLCQQDTLCLSEWVSSYSPIATSALASTPAGIFIFAYTGKLSVNENYGVGKSTSTQPFKMVNGVAFIFLDANGKAIAVSGQSDEFVIIQTPTNNNQIFGYDMSDNGAPVIDDALIGAYRTMAFGLRVLPVVEQVTNTAIPYMTYIVGGQIRAADLNDALTDQDNLYALLQNNYGSRVFGNKEGCNTRYDPFQNEVQLQLQQLTSLLSFDQYTFPAIAVRFSEAIAVDDPVPLILNARFWIEGAIKQPSPIFAEPSHVDVNYDQVRAVFSGNSQSFPLVSKGHTMNRVLEAANVALHISQKAAQGASRLMALSRFPQARRSVRNPQPRRNVQRGRGRGRNAPRGRLPRNPAPNWRRRGNRNNGDNPAIPRQGNARVRNVKK